MDLCVRVSCGLPTRVAPRHGAHRHTQGATRRTEFPFWSCPERIRRTKRKSFSSSVGGHPNGQMAHRAGECPVQGQPSEGGFAGFEYDRRDPLTVTIYFSWSQAGSNWEKCKRAKNNCCRFHYLSLLMASGVSRAFSTITRLHHAARAVHGSHCRG